MDNDLSVIAKKHELQGFRKHEDILSQISDLEVPLKYVISNHLPNARDYDNRRDLIRIFNDIARELYGYHDGYPVVEEFGSFLMDIFDAKSDLDLSINLSDKKAESQRDVKIRTLRMFATKFRSLQKTGHVRNIQSIFSARVPVLKVTDCGTGIECDFSVGNLDGIAKSHIIRIISAIDERFQKLCFLMKAWAKAKDINSSKDGTLNSLSLILLVAFHLQTRNPPIFPPFSSIFKGGINPKAVKKIIPKFLNYGKKNKESVAELFVSLLIVLESMETLWPMGLCASVFEGSWVFKQWQTKKSVKMGDISIEDFTDRSQNTARAVRPRKMRKINTCIRHSLQEIRSFINGTIDAVKLKNKLFSSDSLAGNIGTVSEDSRKRKRKKPTKRSLKRLAKASEKPNENFPSTSFQKGAIRVDSSHEIIGGIQSSSFSQYSYFNQVATTITTNPLNPTRVGPGAFNQGSFRFYPQHAPYIPHVPPPYHSQHFHQQYHPSQYPYPSHQFHHPYHPPYPHYPSHPAHEYSRGADHSWPRVYR